jgi:hypothetical protein
MLGKLDANHEPENGICVAVLGSHTNQPENRQCEGVTCLSGGDDHRLSSSVSNAAGPDAILRVARSCSRCKVNSVPDIFLTVGMLKYCQAPARSRPHYAGLAHQGRIAGITISRMKPISALR